LVSFRGGVGKKGERKEDPGIPRRMYFMVAGSERRGNVRIYRCKDITMGKKLMSEREGESTIGDVIDCPLVLRE